jgi:outer membrane protein assembly factor BamB
LYTVGGDGKLRWKQTLPGIRKGHAYNLEHLVHVLSQSADGAVTTVAGFDELTGVKRFELSVPMTHLKQVNVRQVGSKIVCAADPISKPLRTIVTQLMVNMDGLAYVAFTQNEWTLQAPACTPGTEFKPADVLFSRDEKLVLWQIHSDGTIRSTLVDASTTKDRFSAPVSAASPTGAIITNNSNGVLLSVRWSHDSVPDNISDSPDEYVYRINPGGAVLYKVPLPKYSGPLHDDMVIGEHDIAFATRGGTLIAFNLRTGKETWEWDSGTPEISVIAALANGACMVKIPSGMADVNRGVKTREMTMDGTPVMDWHGNFYRSHDSSTSLPAH